MICINAFDSSYEYSVSGKYPGAFCIFYKLFDMAGLDSIYYLFHSFFVCRRDRGMDVRTNSASKPRKVYIQIQSVIGSFIICHYLFTDMDPFVEAKIYLAFAIAQIVCGMSWDFRDLNLHTSISNNIFSWKFL